MVYIAISFLKGQTSLLIVFQVYKETIKSSGDLERSFFVMLESLLIIFYESFVPFRGSLTECWLAFHEASFLFRIGWNDYCQWHFRMNTERLLLLLKVHLICKTLYFYAFCYVLTLRLLSVLRDVRIVWRLLQRSQVLEYEWKEKRKTWGESSQKKVKTTKFSNSFRQF